MTRRLSAIFLGIGWAGLVTCGLPTLEESGKNRCATDRDCLDDRKCLDQVCVDKDDPCLQAPCTEPHRSICHSDGDTFHCDCDPGYHDLGGSCFPESCTAPEHVPPEVTELSVDAVPIDGQWVALSTSASAVTIDVVFSEPVGPVDQTTIAVAAPATLSVTGGDSQYQLQMANLGAGRWHDVTFGSGIADRCGNPLATVVIRVVVPSPAPTDSFVRQDRFSVCNGECCWEYGATGWANDGRPYALSSVWSGQLQPSSVAGYPLLPWSLGGPTASWKIGPLVKTCNGPYCWEYEDEGPTPGWSTGHAVSLEQEWAGQVNPFVLETGAVFPWSHGGPTASWQIGDETEPGSRTYICNGQYCWIWIDDVTPGWHHTDENGRANPVDLASATQWGGAVQPVWADNDYVFPWSRGGPTASWELDHIIGIGNGRFAWTLDETTEAWLNSGHPDETSVDWLTWNPPARVGLPGSVCEGVWPWD